MKLLKRLGALLFCLLTTSVAAEPLHFVLLAPRVDTFWPVFGQIMSKACEDLDVTCQTFYFEDDHHGMREAILRLGREGQVDAVLFQNLKDQGLSFIEAAESVGLPAILVNTPLSVEQQAVSGGPRFKYKHWLGQIFPDDTQAGYLLAQSLFAEARRKGLRDSSGKIRVLGISGQRADPSGLNRYNGLLKAVEEAEDVVLEQAVFGRWNQQVAYDKTVTLLKRYPLTTVVWSASDLIGFGALQAARHQDRVPGKDLVIGAVDWSDPGLSYVESGLFATDIGGHMFEGAWAVVLLYDYFNGQDFAGERTTFLTQMQIADQTNAGHYRQLFRQGWQHWDFSAYSKVLNSHIRHYDFNLQSLEKP